MHKTKRFIPHIIFFAILVIATMFIQSDLKAGGDDDMTPVMDFKESGSYMTKVIWREDVYDPSLKASINIIKLDENYFSGISDPEKAVLGYLASTIGNECFADGSKDNVKCKILTALNMSYQCSESNKTFLKNWFRNEASIVSQIENCKPTLPESVEKTFDEVKISSVDNVVKVSLKGLKLNIKENSISRWSESMSFKVDGDKLSVLEKVKKN
ncbi:MAG: hypothetical protein IT281_07455 [Ignavibacteria bacterium]|nr:hypothetical protein [Ignavibacteria bacterium]MCC7159359.1 hypothetical protein [Ignavibacteria bacterium]